MLYHTNQFLFALYHKNILAKLQIIAPNFDQILNESCNFFL